jgi:hypothetical protein
MVSRDIGIDLGIDDSEANSKFTALANRADEVADKELKLRKQVARTARKAAMLAMATVGFLRSVYSLAGIQLTALQEAILLSIQQVISTAVAWFTLQAAITAGSYGIQAVGMVAAGAALGVAIGNAAMIAVYGDKIDRRMNDIVGAIVSLEQIAMTFSGEF